MTDSITTSWKLARTESFRAASAAMLGHYGTNMQNPTDSLMRCCIPREGNIFGSRDEAGAEALIVAYEAPPGRFRELFECGIKPHTYFALQIFLDQFRHEHNPGR